MGGKDKDGYGQIMKSASPTLWARAHRVSYEVFIGPIPDGVKVCHTCDNPPCVNPRHLFLGTQGDNMADKVSKGRARGGSMPGETHPGAHLSDADRQRVRSLAGVLSQRELARLFGVHQATIHRIISGKTKT